MDETGPTLMYIVFPKSIRTSIFGQNPAPYTVTVIPTVPILGVTNVIPDCIKKVLVAIALESKPSIEMLTSPFA